MLRQERLTQNKQHKKPDSWDTPTDNLRTASTARLLRHGNDLVFIFILKCSHQKRKDAKQHFFFFCKHENYLPVLKYTKPGVITFPEGGKKSVFLYFFFEFHGQVGEIRKINESRHSSCVDVKFTYLCSPLPYFFCFTDAISPVGLTRCQLEATFSDDTQLILFDLLTSVGWFLLYNTKLVACGL